MDSAGAKNTVDAWLSQLHGNPPRDSLGERLALGTACRRFGGSDEPVQLGRFVIRRTLGRGGQGSVYEGFDPELQRSVALKAPRYVGRGDPVSEARALARVRHPNLVAVHELVVCDGRPVVVMELVEGTPLIAWVRSRRPSLRAIVEVVAKVGDGLAELHRCGLTHRDVKPDNIVVDARGEPRLVDLGLAAASGSVEHAGGTPGFAAPEQRRRATVDPAADQFGLAATLRRALEVARAEGRARVGRRLLATLERASASDSSKRFGDVAAFTRALRRTQRRFHWWVPLSIAASMGAVASAGFAEKPKCRIDSGKLSEAAWSAERRVALRERFEEMDGWPGRRAWATADAHLDAFAREWSEAARAVCDSPAGHRGEGPRAYCLDDAAHRFEAVVADLQLLDANTASVAVDLAVSLPPPQRCTDIALQHLPSPPANENVVQIRRRLSDVAQRCSYGLTADCAADFDAIATDAKASAVDPCGWEPLWLFFVGASGQYQNDGWATLTRAHQRAEACAQDSVRLDAQRVLAEQAALRGDSEAAQFHLDGAAATLERIGHAKPETIALLASEAVVMLNLGRPHEAQPAAEQALSLHAAMPGGHPFELAQLQGLASQAAFELGRPDRALELQERSLALLRSLYGPGHPVVARAMSNLAISIDSSELKRARTLNREAVAIFAAHAGHELPLGATLVHKAGFDRDSGEHEAARQAIERALQAFTTAGDPDNAFVGDALVIDADLRLSGGDRDGALRSAERAVSILLATRGPSDATTLQAELQLASVQERLGQADRARALRCTVHRKWTANFAHDHPLTETFTTQECEP